jgi:hypothetical protein
LGHATEGNHAVRVLMAVVGIILLLPGVCALLFMLGTGFDTELMGLWIISFLISAGGVALLYGAFGRPPRNDRPMR